MFHGNIQTIAGQFNKNAISAYALTQSSVYKYLNDHFYKNSFAILLNSGAMAISGLLFWIIAAHYVPVDQVGYATAIISVVTLITALSSLGMDNGLIRFLPMIENKGELYSTVLAVVTACSLTLAFLFLIFTPFLSPSLSFLRSGWFPLIFLGFTFVMSVGNIQSVAFMAIRRSELLLAQSLILALRIPALILIASLAVAGVISSFILAYFAAFIFGTFILLNYGLRIKLTFNKQFLRKMISYTSSNFIAELFYILPTAFLPLMVVGLLGAEDAAYYYIAYSIASVLFMIPQAVSLSLFVEGSYAQSLRDNVVKSMKFIGLILLPTVIFIFLFGDRLLLFFSKEYSDQAFEILKLMAISSLFSSIVSIYVSIHRVTKHVVKIILPFVAISVLQIVLGYYLMQGHGLIGLGYAWLASYIIVSAGIVVSALREKDGIEMKKWID